jgi:transposase
LELSKNSWLLAIQFPDREQPSLYPIEGGDTEKLMVKLSAARDCCARVSGALPVILVARFLKARGIECLVIDPGSVQVNRRGRPVKVDRVDMKVLLRTLIAWCRGKRHVWSLVRIPSIDEEDLRRSHRERSRLVCERTAHINRIKGLLLAQGIRGIKGKSQYKTLAVDKLLTGDGHRLPPRLASEIAREIQRLAMVQKQIAGIEREVTRHWHPQVDYCERALLAPLECQFNTRSPNWPASVVTATMPPKCQTSTITATSPA